MDMLNISNKRTLSLATYRKLRIGITIVTAFIFSQMLVLQNYVIPVATLVVSALVLLYLRSRVDGIIADERDRAIAGRAALLAMQLTSWAGAIGTFVFYAMRDQDPTYELLGIVLSSATFLLLITYSVAFHLMSRSSHAK